jgi:uncharacterized protein YfaS (alpha-2-macroglobulin family)
MNNKKANSSSSSIFSTLFGRINWTSPPWLSYLNHKSSTSPKSFWSSVTLFIALLVAAGYGIHWYQNLPEPIYVTASISEPEITPNAEELIPGLLTIDFGVKEGNEFRVKSVAPINSVGKNVEQGIEINPKIEGTWYWASDSHLIFTPSQDWPAGQKYTIHTDPSFFVPKTKFKSNDFTFSTKPFAATIKEFKFYQDPVTPDNRKVVATIEFNYPVNEESLKQNTSLMFQAVKNNQLNLNTEPVAFTYTYDANKRTAYLSSDPIKIQDYARYLRLTIEKKVNPNPDTTKLNQEVSQNVLIPDATNFLSVLSSSASIVRNDKDKPEQVLTIETTLGINESDFNNSVHLYLLPQNYPATRTTDEIQNYNWQNPGEVTSTILSLSKPLNREALPAEHNYSTLHSFKFSSQTPRFIYVKIDKGMQGFGGFKLANNYSSIIAVPEYPKEISFLHKGSLLALDGEKKLSVLIRGVPAVKFDFARVLPGNINQLITQTQGDFNNPYFINPSFNQQNISQIFSDIQQFNGADLTKQQYTALDIGRYLSTEANANGPQGLFLLQATGWDVANKAPLDAKASRLILVTDLGMLVKDNYDGSHDVFVSSISKGVPVTGATISVLGKNGVPIITRTTDIQGRATIPTLRDYVEDKEPVVYTATLSNDVSFIPYNNYNRQLNFSKFDIGGIYSNGQDTQANLSAYLFSDRGIYRPGDQVHIGMIVKKSYAIGQAGGIPLQVSVVDSRGTTIKDEKITLNDLGFMSLDFATQDSSPTGQYTIYLYLVKDDHSQNLLGSTTVKIDEFLPDRMRISANFLPKPTDGWISSTALKAQVDLWNLYGAPATDRKIGGKLLLIPEQVQFDQYPDYMFYDPLLDPKKPQKTFSEDLTAERTNDQGHAEFALNLEQYEKATYQLTFFAEGFEADSGRSVTTQIKTLVSPLPYFVGYKADGDLTFIKQNSERNINYLAINPQLTKEEISDLKLQLISLHPVSTLIKAADGTYQYQSIIQSTVLKTTAFAIHEQNTTYSVPTDEIGDFALNVLDKNNAVLSQLKFTVVGASQAQLSRNAELSVKLNKEEYKAGEDIQLQLTAPYTGSGLITIERDKVYATQWFKSETNNSMQTIHIPEDFQGNGYINVAYIRDWNSPELFISPLSYSVIPFTVNNQAHNITIDLQTPEVVKPGQDLTIDYHTDKPGKIVVFAVDEGILQVAGYDTPDPLAFFFQKHALEVITQQTVDQILPKFIQDRELSAAGGDDSLNKLIGLLNPFKRKTDLPVAFWSGIIDTDSRPRQLHYQVPDYFNGKLRVMAVAVSEDSVGASETAAEVRGDFIINPNVPTFVAPGDDFELSATVANNVKDSGDHAAVAVSINLSPQLELISQSQQTIEIAEGREQAVRFKVRAKSSLGSATITLTASLDDKTAAMNSTLSVRPAAPLSTIITDGKEQEKQRLLDVIQTFYPEYHTANATVSTSPLILVFGLEHYLNNYPYGCTEQLTSKALPLLAMGKQTWFAQDRSKITDKVNETIQLISQRQMSSGGFSYWPGLADSYGTSFVSVYAMHFLTEAREQGFVVPNDMFFNGVSYLKQLAGQNASSLYDARIQAYAIYILTRNELVTTNYLANLQLYIQQNYPKEWQSDIAAAYIAASYKLLKSTEEANKLIGQFKLSTTAKDSYVFYNDATINAEYFYLLAKHFPNLLNQWSDQLLDQMLSTINSNQLDSLLAGYSSLALGAYAEQTSVNTPSLSITQLMNDGNSVTSDAPTGNYLTAPIGNQTKQLQLNNPNKLTYFYLFNQSGYNAALPEKPENNGIEVYREYRNAKGQVVDTVALGDEVEVHIKARAVDSDYIANVAIEDLLPGGFEVVRESVSNNSVSYVDIREDRVNLFTDLDSATREIVYKIKAVNVGQYTSPPIYAEGMYNPSLQAHGIASKISVNKNQ